ncbi:hypothetical protein EVAR_71317_1 [Eumeta japonica]|uniref:Uncharacterized protein n=1 Tax=Eumeta variegata TaxID=151549 RepID=A0A4C2AA63_EUMVA|nr:hypothetical protein EVAR_71317_1 [Eumeta japonica]
MCYQTPINDFRVNKVDTPPTVNASVLVHRVYRERRSRRSGESVRKCGQNEGYGCWRRPSRVDLADTLMNSCDIKFTGTTVDDQPSSSVEIPDKRCRSAAPPSLDKRFDKFHHSPCSTTFKGQ